MLRSCVALLAVAAAAGSADPPAAPLEVAARTRYEVNVPKTVTGPGGGTVTTSERVVQARDDQRSVDPRKCAVVICDVWDDHWCKSAARRCDALARAAGPVVEAARRQGMTVIHCPSDCMAYYADHPARTRAQAVKPTPPPKNKDLPDPPLPIDDTDGGCDDVPPAKFSKAWTKQHAAIRVDPDRDYVTDSGKEVYGVLADRGLTTVFVMGVHTNFCVLHRSFGIKQLRRWGVDCLLVRDLTDAMYNPARRPTVSHDAGTGLVVEFIERHWCPTVESKDLTGAK